MSIVVYLDRHPYNYKIYPIWKIDINDESRPIPVIWCHNSDWFTDTYRSWPLNLGLWFALGQTGQFDVLVGFHLHRLIFWLHCQHGCLWNRYTKVDVILCCLHYLILFTQHNNTDDSRRDQQIDALFQCRNVLYFSIYTLKVTEPPVSNEKITPIKISFFSIWQHTIYKFLLAFNLFWHLIVPDHLDLCILVHPAFTESKGQNYQWILCYYF